MPGKVYPFQVSMKTDLSNTRITRLLPLYIMIILCIVPAGCFFPGAVEDIDVRQLESIIKKEKKLVIIDDRTKFEYSSGHIPGAVNVPQEDFPMIASFLPADKHIPLIFYCGGYS